MPSDRPLQRYIPSNHLDITTLRTEVHRNSLYVGLSYESGGGGSLSRYEPGNLFLTFYWVDHIGDIRRYDWTQPGNRGVQVTSRLDPSFVFVESVGLDLDMASTRGNWVFLRFCHLTPSQYIDEILLNIAFSQRCDSSSAWGFMFLSRLVEQGLLRVTQTELEAYWSYIVNGTFERYVDPYIGDHHCLPRDFTEFRRRRAPRMMYRE